MKVHPDDARLCDESFVKLDVSKDNNDNNDCTCNQDEKQHDNDAKPTAPNANISANNDNSNANDKTAMKSVKNYTEQSCDCVKYAKSSRFVAVSAPIPTISQRRLSFESHDAQRINSANV
jgi:hypothetical protein